jgi:hypothetical protein
MSAIRFILILAGFVLIGGCTSPKPMTDPLAGFHAASKGLDQSIVNDYQNYIQKLSPEEKKYLGPYPASFFEDGTGQHAVRIETDIDGKDCWYHILFYDKDNKRVKVVKYFYGRYRS